MSTCVTTEGCTKGAAIGYMCVGHYDRLARMLDDLELEAALLSAIPSMQQRMDGGGGSLPSTRSPARLDVLVHRDRRRGTGKSETEDDAMAAGETLPILDVLSSWARIVREERQLAATGSATIVGERALLLRNLDWIAAQDWIDEMYRDVRQLVGQLRAANGTRPEKPVAVCPVTTVAGICGGDVWQHDETQAVWRRHPDRCTQKWEQAPGRLACESCGATWTTDADKARFKVMVADVAREATRPRTADGRPMYTAQEIVDRKLMSTLSNVRTTAHRRRIVSVDGHYDVDALTAQESA